MPHTSSRHNISQDAFKHSDRAVLKYLNELTHNSGVETCTASIRQIAAACDISERQVQISTRRLINARFLQRVGYDFSNPDRAKRGTVFKVLINIRREWERAAKDEKKKSIKFLLYWSED